MFANLEGWLAVLAALIDLVVALLKLGKALLKLFSLS